MSCFPCLVAEVMTQVKEQDANVASLGYAHVETVNTRLPTHPTGRPGSLETVNSVSHLHRLKSSSFLSLHENESMGELLPSNLECWN